MSMLRLVNPDLMNSSVTPSGSAAPVQTMTQPQAVTTNVDWLGQFGNTALSGLNGLFGAYTKKLAGDINPTPTAPSPRPASPGRAILGQGVDFTKLAITGVAVAIGGIVLVKLLD